MSSSNQLPSKMAVLVCEIRHGSQLWPVLRIDQRADDHVHFISGSSQAPIGLRVLQQATELCLVKASQIAAVQLAQGIASGTTPLAALLPQTAVPTGTPHGSDVRQDNSGTAEPLSTPLVAESNNIVINDNINEP